MMKQQAVQVALRANYTGRLTPIEDSGKNSWLV